MWYYGRAWDLALFPVGVRMLVWSGTRFFVRGKERISAEILVRFVDIVLLLILRPVLPIVLIALFPAIFITALLAGGKLRSSEWVGVLRVELCLKLGFRGVHWRARFGADVEGGDGVCDGRNGGFGTWAVVGKRAGGRSDRTATTTTCVGGTAAFAWRRGRRSDVQTRTLATALGK